MKWSHTVNFVVGDSFADRILFWNARHYVPAWLDGGIVTLKATEEELADPVRFSEIVEIIRNRIYLPLGGSASHSQIILRSTSVSSDALEALRARFQAAQSFNVFTIEHLDSLDLLAPSASTLEHANRHAEPGSPFQALDWHEISIADETFRPPAITPRHIREPSPVPPSLRQGMWALDIDMERAVNHSGIQNVQHRWRLPRRLRTVAAFLGGYQLAGGSSAICMPRSTESGLLSVAVSDSLAPEICVPIDEIVFQHALCGQENWWPFVRGKDKPKPGIAFAIRPSDKGRYLTALLRMAGSVQAADEIFLSDFWRSQFETLGATPKATEDRIAAVKATLRKRLKAGRIEDEDAWTRLAQTVLSEARAVRSASRFLRFDDLTTDFETYRNAYWATHQAGAPRDEWDDYEKRSLVQSVKYLCQREIIHQGHEWRCPQCFNNNWLGIDKLGRTMRCEICGTEKAAPVADPWHFKLNGFILEGIREHGLLPVVWCLSNLASRSRNSFYYLEPHLLFYTPDRFDSQKNDAEVDLVIVSDGNQSSLAETAMARRSNGCQRVPGGGAVTSCHRASIRQRQRGHPAVRQVEKAKTRADPAPAGG